MSITMKHTTITRLLLLAALAMSASSCRHKDLYMLDEPSTQHIVVQFDWRNAPDANPESMAMYLYDSDYLNPRRYIFNNRFGGETKVTFGTHHALCLNADNTNWAHLGYTENHRTFQISTLDADRLSGQGLQASALPRAKSAESERMACTPLMAWGSSTSDINIIPKNGTDTIKFYPDELVCHYTVDIYDVDNLDGVNSTSIDAGLSGMAEGMNVARNIGTDNTVTMAFTLSTVSNQNALHGEFLTFGECENTHANHFLTIYTILVDGSKWCYTYDVTGQITNAPDPRHVHIVVRGLPLPQPPPGGGGAALKPDVNDWQIIDIHLQM